MTSRSLFLSADGRPRALWRIALFVALLAVAGGALVPLAGWLGARLGSRPAGFSTGACLALVVAHWAALRFVDRRGWAAVGLDRAAARPGVLAGATLLGAAAIGVPVLALWGAGWLHLVSGPPGSSLAQASSAAIVLLPAALAEELLLRGYLFAALRDGLGLA